MFTEGVRLVLTRSSCSSSSEGILDSKSGGNSRSVNSSTNGIDADFLHKASS